MTNEAVFDLSYKVLEFVVENDHLVFFQFGITMNMIFIINIKLVNILLILKCDFFSRQMLKLRFFFMVTITKYNNEY